MGLAAATFRLMYLNSFRFDLENRIQSITESKMSLTRSINDLVSAESDMDPESEIVKQLQARKDKLNALDKKLDMQLEMYNNQLKMIDKALESCRGMIDKNIERTFTYGK